MKKNLGKVKHYNRGLHSAGGRLLRGAALVLGAAAILFALGWFVGPALVNFGTHTWYTLVKGRELADSTSAAQSEAAQSEAAQSEAAQSEDAPTPAPTVLPAAVGEGSWSFVPLSALGSPEQIAATAQSLKESGVEYAVVTLKDTSGYLYYTSSVENAAGSIAATTVDAAAIARIFAESGLTPVAAVSAFQDPLAPYTDRSMGIRYQGTEYFWLDAAANAGGKPWLDPYSESAVGFVAEILSEVRALGYENVLVSGMQFPPYATENCAYAGGQPADAARLAELIDSWQGAFAAEGGRLWFQYPLASVAAAEPIAALAGTWSQLGVESLVVQMPAEPSDGTAALWQRAVSGLQSAGTTFVIQRSGDSALYQTVADAAAQIAAEQSQPAAPDTAPVPAA